MIEFENVTSLIQSVIGLIVQIFDSNINPQYHCKTTKQNKKNIWWEVSAAKLPHFGGKTAILAVKLPYHLGPAVIKKKLGCIAALPWLDISHRASNRQPSHHIGRKRGRQNCLARQQSHQALQQPTRQRSCLHDRQRCLAASTPHGNMVAVTPQTAPHQLEHITVPRVSKT